MRSHLDISDQIDLAHRSLSVLRSVNFLRYISALFVSILVWPGLAQSIAMADQRQVTFYSTYGYNKNGVWIIPLRVLVHEPSTKLRLAARGARRIIAQIARLDDPSDAQKQLYKDRMRGFLIDRKSGERVAITFDRDPENRKHQLASVEGTSETNFNGLLMATLKLTEDYANRLLEAQNSGDGWLGFRAVSREHTGKGRVRLLPANGLSVVSDIDDTIKVTDIRDGKRKVLNNTLFKDFVAAPCMAKLYSSFGEGVAFHYVSGGPWQLYTPLSQFVTSDAAGFPEGSFHMKNVRTNPLEMESFEDIWKLLAKGEDGKSKATFDQKIEDISDLINNFPQRDFVFVGDSGEKDPEIYREIMRRFPKALIKDVYIRDVINAASEDTKTRLAGMTTIGRDANQDGSCILLPKPQ